MLFRAALGVLIVISSLGLLSCRAFDYSNIASRVFEVVVKLNLSDNFQYDREVPEDELSFYEKNRKYDSIGTAFAIEGGKFVSAAHVFDILSPTQMEGFYLRDGRGQIYEIGSVLAYDYSKDYIVFTVPELKVQGLPLATEYSLNSKVYSVGNALGEGIVFRDGMLTSETLDGDEGKWSWLRFSAPASPGNSGGPLVNEWGQVLGIIEMKSESENLNYALPIKEVQEDKLAKFSFNYEYAFPSFQDTRYKKFDFHAKLPLSLNELASKAQKPYQSFVVALGEELRNADENERFPKQEGARILFGKGFDADIIAGIEQKADYTWQYKDSEFESQSTLKSGGRVTFGSLWGFTTFALSLDDLAEPLDSATFMDNLLQTYYIARPMGASSVRVRSMGAAASTEVLSDKFGRSWTFLQFNDPKFDEATLVLYVHLPNGFVGVISNISYGDILRYRQDYRLLADQLYFNYEGNVSQWKAYLSNPLIKRGPELESLSLSLNSSKDQRILEIQDRNEYLKVDLKRAGFGEVAESGIDVSIMTSIFGHDQAWSIKGIKVDPSGLGDASFESLKILEPGPVSDKKEREQWERLRGKKSPFDDRVTSVHDTKLIQSVSMPANLNNENVVYLLKTNMGQETDDKLIKKVHSQIVRDFRVQ